MEDIGFNFYVASDVEVGFQERLPFILGFVEEGGEEGSLALLGS